MAGTDQGGWAAVLDGAPHDRAAWVELLPAVRAPTVEIVPRDGREPEHLPRLPSDREIADDGEAGVAMGLVEHLTA